MLERGALALQAVGAADAAGQYDPDGHTTGNDALNGQYMPDTQEFTLIMMQHRNNTETTNIDESIR